MKTLSFFYGRCPFPCRLRNNIFQSPRHACFHVSLSFSCICRHNFKFDTKSEVALYKNFEKQIDCSYVCNS